MVIDVIFEFFTKLSGNISTPSPIATVEMLVFGISPIEVQFLGFHAKFCILLQPSKAYEPIDVTELGIDSDVILEFLHKYAGIFSTSLPNEILVIDEIGALVKSPQSFAFQFTVFEPLQP